nr:MAG TPA: hypothetical protein [Caudoviricetes sp.]
MKITRQKKQTAQFDSLFLLSVKVIPLVNAIFI